jgi:hypothetical protein
VTSEASGSPGGVTTGVTGSTSVSSWVENPGAFMENFLAVWHNRIPRSFRPLAVSRDALRLGLAASGPLVAFYTTKQDPTVESELLAYAVYGSSALLAGHLILSLLEKLARQRSEKTPLPDSIAVRSGEIIAMMRSPRTQQDKDTAICSGLGLIQQYVALLAKLPPDSVSVSVCTYRGSSQRMQIRHRNVGNGRRVGPVNAPIWSILGHHACQDGTAPKVVHDLRRMQEEFQRSPSESPCNYRSFLIIPLETTRNGQKSMLGFLSIDAERPFAFYGNRSRKIIGNCNPIIEMTNESL